MDQKKDKTLEIVLTVIGAVTIPTLVGVTPNIAKIIFAHWTRIVWLVAYFVWLCYLIYILCKKSDQWTLLSFVIELFLLLVGWTFILRDGLQLDMIKETTLPFLQTLTSDLPNPSNSINALVPATPTLTTTPTKNLMQFTDTPSPTATSYPKIEVCYKPKDEEGSRYIRSSPDDSRGTENVIYSIYSGDCFEIDGRTDLLYSSRYPSLKYHYWVHLAKIIDRDEIALTDENGTLIDGWILFDVNRFIINIPINDFKVEEINTVIPSLDLTKTPAGTQAIESTLTSTSTK